MTQKDEFLRSWTCDTCGDSVNIEGGMLAIDEDEQGRGRRYRIVHNTTECLNPYGNFSDFHLSECVGPNGISLLLSYLDPSFDGGDSQVADLRSFAEVFRRLHIPMYEQTRKYLRDQYDDPSDRETWVTQTRMTSALARLTSEK